MGEGSKAIGRPRRTLTPRPYGLRGESRRGRPSFVSPRLYGHLALSRSTADGYHHTAAFMVSRPVGVGQGPKRSQVAGGFVAGVGGTEVPRRRGECPLSGPPSGLVWRGVAVRRRRPCRLGPLAIRAQRGVPRGDIRPVAWGPAGRGSPEAPRNVPQGRKVNPARRWEAPSEGWSGRRQGRGGSSRRWSRWCPRRGGACLPRWPATCSRPRAPSRGAARPPGP
jgi:hypothetical protein